MRRNMDVSRNVLLEEQPNTIPAQLPTVIHQQCLVHTLLGQLLFPSSFRCERLGEKRVVRLLGQDG